MKKKMQKKRCSTESTSLTDDALGLWPDEASLETPVQRLVCGDIWASTEERSEIDLIHIDAHNSRVLQAAHPSIGLNTVEGHDDVVYISAAPRA